MNNIQDHLPAFEKLKEGIREATKLHLPNHKLVRDPGYHS